MFARRLPPSQSSIQPLPDGNRYPVRAAAHARLTGQCRSRENFQQNTLRALKELIAAAGLDHPGELGPEHIIRRVSGNEVRSLATLYTFVRPGELLEQTAAHAVFQRFWSDARADSFAPPPGIAEMRWSKMI